MKSGGNISLLSMLLVLAAANISEGTPDETYAFETFLMLKLRNYSEWLLSKNLDPTPVITENIDISSHQWAPLFNYSASIWNQRIFNHSNIYSWEVFADLENFDLTVRIDMLELQMTGQYKMEGYYANETVEGSGTFEIQGYEAQEGGPFLLVGFEKFEVTAEGFVSLAGAGVAQMYTAEHAGKFQGLSGGAYNDRLETNMATKQGDLFEEWNPLAEYLQTYLQEIFSQTSFAEIISS